MQWKGLVQSWKVSACTLPMCGVQCDVAEPARHAWHAGLLQHSPSCLSEIRPAQLWDARVCAARQVASQSPQGSATCIALKAALKAG